MNNENQLFIVNCEDLCDSCKKKCLNGLFTPFTSISKQISDTILLIKEKGLSEKEIAAKIGVNPKYIIGLKNGSIQPKRDCSKLALLSKLTNVLNSISMEDKKDDGSKVD